MRKSTLTSIEGHALGTLPSIKGVHPVGTQILVELITPDELAGPQTNGLVLPESAKKGMEINGAPQAYVVELGPKVDPAYNVAVGNRIVLSGTFTPLPEATATSGRPLACIEPHTIKAILVE